MAATISPIASTIYIWPGCAKPLARALRRVQREWVARPPHTRYRAIPRLVDAHVEPALAAAIKATGWPEWTFGRAWGCEPLSKRLAHPASFDRDLCALARTAHGTLDESIDTLRELGHWVADQQPVKRAKLKGEPRRDERVARFGATRDWPYCECCGELCQRAERMPHAEAGSEAERLSARFCNAHSPTESPSVHRATMRRRKAFKATLRAIYAEMRINREFASRFADHAWAGETRQPIDMDAVTSILAMHTNPSLITDPVKTLARRYAYRIAQEAPSRTLLDIARLRMSGFAQSSIAAQLGIKRSTVSMQIFNHDGRGYFDFSHHSDLLCWWPDRAVIGKSAFRLETQRKPKQTGTDIKTTYSGRITTQEVCP